LKFNRLLDEHVSFIVMVQGGEDTFPRNVGFLSSAYMTLNPRREMATFSVLLIVDSNF
jgi:hypothetical protein